MWLMCGLKPDFRTISDFRKDNIGCMKKVYKEFVKRVTVDMETGFVSIDGSKFKAWNSKDRNRCITGKGQWKGIDFNKDTLEKKAKWWEADGSEGPDGTPNGGKKRGITIGKRK